MKIAIIEDEKLLSATMSKKLKSKGFKVKIFDDIESFNNFNNKNFDIYIIDILLTDWIWFSVLENIRNKEENKSVVILISWLNKEENKIYWLNTWADDFLIKPFSPDELIARINAITRRISNNMNYKEDITYKDIIYKYSNNKIFKNNLEILLQWKEKDIVEFFIRNKWKIIKKIDLINSVWGEYEESFISDNNINVSICNVRKKLWKEFELETIHTKWYLLKE